MDVLRWNAHWLGLWINSEKGPLYCDSGRSRTDHKNIVEYSEIKRFETSKMNSNITACL